MFNTYDFIIIGSGAAGCVIAARLSEIKNCTVLILEAGQDNSKSSTDPIMSDWDKSLITVPALSSVLHSRYNKTPLGNLSVSKTLDSFITIPQGDDPKLNKIYAYPRGNGAGGSTNHNGLVYGRGDPNVYNNIATYVDDPIWSYDNILPYYRKMETYNIPNGASNIHGKNGWLKIKQSGNLKEDLRKEMINAITKTPENIPFRKDPNEPSQIAGVYITQQQVDENNVRSNSFESLLYPKIQKQSNITMKFNALVKNIIIKNDKAVGVVTYEKKYLHQYNISGNLVIDNNTVKIPDKNFPISTKYYAKKEVIICAGAIKTPQILMLSGLGPKEHLIDLGIEVIKDISGVGQNLMDHMESNLIYSLDPSKIIWTWQASYFKQYMNYKTSPYRDQIIKFGKDKWSNISTDAISLILDWYSYKVDGVQDVKNPPDIHVHAINGSYIDFNKEFKIPNGDNYQVEEHSYDDILPNPDGNANFSHGVPGKEFMINKQYDINDPYVLLDFLSENYPININSLGSIKLKSDDCREQPIIDLNLWSDDAAQLRLANTIMKLRDIMNSPEMLLYSKSGKYDNNYELYPGKKYDTIDKLKDFIKIHQGYGHHMGGTARMGNATDNGAVLDSRLKVRGIKGLRVVDASIYPAPYLHAYNPTGGIYVMSEVASDFIKKEYYKSSSLIHKQKITARNKFKNKNGTRRYSDIKYNSRRSFHSNRTHH